MNEFHISKKMSSTLFTLPYMISIGLGPPLGLWIDKVGRRATLISVSSGLVMFSCLLTAVLIMVDFTETAWWCILPLISLGVAYSIYASALWTAIPFVTTPECYGTAFGLVTTIQ